MAAPGARRDGSSGSRVLARGWCELTRLPARVHLEKCGWVSAVLAGSALGVCAGLGDRSRHGVVCSARSCCESCSLGERWDLQGREVSPQRAAAYPGAGAAAAQASPACPTRVPRMFGSLDSRHTLLLALLPDCPATSVLPAHARRGAGSALGACREHVCPHTTAASASWARCTASTACETPRLPAGWWGSHGATAARSVGAALPRPARGAAGVGAAGLGAPSPGGGGRGQDGAG